MIFIMSILGFSSLWYPFHQIRILREITHLLIYDMWYFTYFHQLMCFCFHFILPMSFIHSFSSCCDKNPFLYYVYFHILKMENRIQFYHQHYCMLIHDLFITWTFHAICLPFFSFFLIKYPYKPHFQLYHSLKPHNCGECFAVCQCETTKHRFSLSNSTFPYANLVCWSWKAQIRELFLQTLLSIPSSLLTHIFKWQMIQNQMFGIRFDRVVQALHNCILRFDTRREYAHSVLLIRISHTRKCEAFPFSLSSSSFFIRISQHSSSFQCASHS